MEILFIGFGIVILLFMITAEIFSVLFQLTGLSEEKSNFQSISLLSSCGFTTKESETITSSNARRKIAKTAMIFGYIFSACFISLFVSVFINLNNADKHSTWITLLIVAGVVLLCFVLSRVKVIKKSFDAIIFKFAHRISKKQNANFIRVIDTYGENSLVEVTILKNPEIFNDKTIEQSQIKQIYKIIILAIIRSQKTIYNITKDEIIKQNDIITIYGNLNTIKELFEN